MKLKQKVNKVIESGIEPIFLKYDEVKFFDEGSRVVRTSLNINSLDVGVLEYDQYRFVAARSKQAEQLVRCHFTKLLRMIYKSAENGDSVSCYTLPVHARVLRDGQLSRLLFDGFAKFETVAPSRICVEISADVLYEETDWLLDEIEKIRSLGVKIALSEVGDEFCPVFRLSSIDFDYAFLDTHAISLALSDNNEETANWLIDFLHSRRVRVVAPCLNGEKSISILRDLDCDGYTLSKSDGEEVM